MIPIGCALTVAAFTGAYRAVRKGDHEQVQRMFRARVAAQAFTVVAMVAGGVYFSEDRKKTKELRELKAQQEAEEKRVKWIKELEIRDEEDKALREKLDRRRKKAADRMAVEATTGSTEGVAAQAKAALQETKSALEEAGNENKKGGSVMPSLGGWLGGSSSKPDDAGKRQSEEKPAGETTRK